MSIEQLSIFLENKTGRMAEVTGALAEANINIKALSLADTSEFGILRLIVDNNELARDALKTKGFTVARTQVAAVAIPHTAGGLHVILKILEQRGINVEYMYVFPYHSADAVLIFRFDRMEQALEELLRRNVRMFSEGELFA